MLGPGTQPQVGMGRTMNQEPSLQAMWMVWVGKMPVVGSDMVMKLLFLGKTLTEMDPTDPVT